MEASLTTRRMQFRVMVSTEDWPEQGDGGPALCMVMTGILYLCLCPARGKLLQFLDSSLSSLLDRQGNHSQPA